MQERLTIARPYAEAAFDIATEAGAVDEWSGQLATLAAIVRDSRIAMVVSDPRVSRARLVELVTGIAGADFSDDVTRLIKVLVESGRLALAPELSTLVERARAEARGVAEVELTTAWEVTEEQSGRIGEAIRGRLGRDVTVTASVDDSLIGGAIIRVGDSVIDASVRGRLRELASSIG